MNNNSVNSIKNLVNEDPMIVVRRIFPYWAFLAICVGVVVAFLAGSVDNSREGLASALMFVGGTVAIIGVVCALRPIRRSYYRPTNERIRKNNYCFDPAHRQKIEQMLSRKAVDEIVALSVKDSTSLMMTLYSTRSGSYTACQLLEYVPYEYVPLTQPLSFVR